jgi:hypothetical protein
VGVERGGGGRRPELGPYRWLPPAAIILGVLIGIALKNPAIGLVLGLVLGLGTFVVVRLILPRD